LHRNVNAVRKRLAEGVRYDYCVFNNSKTSTGLIRQVRDLGIKTITIHHNVEPEFVRDNTPNWLHRTLLMHLVKKAERTAWQLSDYNLFLTRQDLQTFKSLYGENHSINGIIGTFEYNPMPEIKLKERDPQHLTISITGTLCLQQGIDGIRYFFDELYQYLPEGAKVIISGRQPTEEVKALCSCHGSNVQLIPNPDDMSEVINKADIYLCPTRLGGGLKLRVMDGLRLGLPVIVHSCSARGYDELAGSDCLSVFDSKEEFASELQKLVEKIQNGTIRRDYIRQRYEEVFSYQAGLRRLKAILSVED
jgi:glycosyltransferase involved in cell wall biosynthesis